MGASYCEMSVSRDMPAAKLKEHFANVQDQDRYENGHSYSGGFGMADGLSIKPNEFASVAEAQKWLQANCQKWEAALAVTATDTREVLVGWKIKDPDSDAMIDKPNPNHGARLWIIGAVCSS